MKILIHLLVSTLAILISAYILPGVHVTGIFAALVLAIVLGIINTFLRPILIFLTLPITVLSLGIFILFINAFLIILASHIVPGFFVASFGSAFLFGIVLAIISWALGFIEKEE